MHETAYLAATHWPFDGNEPSNGSTHAGGAHVESAFASLLASTESPASAGSMRASFGEPLSAASFERSPPQEAAGIATPISATPASAIRIRTG
jgi:hypothetical protein